MQWLRSPDRERRGTHSLLQNMTNPEDSYCGHWRGDPGSRLKIVSYGRQGLISIAVVSKEDVGRKSVSARRERNSEVSVIKEGEKNCQPTRKFR